MSEHGVEHVVQSEYVVERAETAVDVVDGIQPSILLNEHLTEGLQTIDTGV